jgi:hypothetical protein
MATRWTNRVNPFSWFTQRRARTAPVVPGGRHEFSTPAEYVKTSQDDYSAADRPSQDSSLEWFAESASSGQFSPNYFQPNPRSSGEYPVPRTASLEYDLQRLRIEYTRGGTYDYDGVTMAMWNGISSAQSTGRWINRNLLGWNQGTKV